VEARSNTSTVALRVVGGDEKGTRCLGVQANHLVPGGYKYGDLALQFVRSLESQRVKDGHESGGMDLRMTALARASTNFKRQTNPLVKDKDYNREWKIIVSLKGLSPRQTDWR
jgi:hypothetical protein